MTPEERAAKVLDALVGEQTTMGWGGYPEPALNPNKWKPAGRLGEAYTVILDHIREIEAEAEKRERAACAEIANQHGDALWKQYKQGKGPLRADPWAEGGSDAAHHIATLIEDRGKPS